MYCANCGKKLKDNNRCEDCYPSPAQNDDNGNLWWAILGFLFPLVGLILYIVWFSSKPNNASAAGIGAIIGTITKAIIIIVIIISIIFHFSDVLIEIVNEYVQNVSFE